MPVSGAPVKSTVQGGLHGRPPAGGPAAAGMIGRGVLWLLGSVVSARRGTLVLGIIAGRVFTPGQFGAVAAALVVVLAFRSLGEFGASRALERYEGDPREVAPAVMTISAISGAALAALCFTMSTALASAAGTAAAAPLIRVLAFDILIGGLVAAPAAMLRLHPRGIRRSIADQSGNWLGVILGCWLAVSGHGLLSFGIGLLAGAILRAIMIVIFAPTSLRMGLGRGHMRLLAGSALPLAGLGPGHVRAAQRRPAHRGPPQGRRVAGLLRPGRQPGQLADHAPGRTGAAGRARVLRPAADQPAAAGLGLSVVRRTPREPHPARRFPAERDGRAAGSPGVWPRVDAGRAGAGMAGPAGRAAAPVQIDQ